MSPEQSRAARGWLAWSQADLAAKAKVSLSTVRDFEKGRHEPIAATLEAMRRAFISGGIEFLEQEGKAVGIRFSQMPTDLITHAGIAGSDASAKR